jgi:Fic family protein
MSLPLPPLPIAPSEMLETRAVLKQAAEAHRYLAELKGLLATIPNEAILLNTLSLQEARDSSAVENIITSHDELFRAELQTDGTSPATKEVQNYVQALKLGFARVRQTGLLRLDDILAIQQVLEKNRAGLRKLPGTVLRNQQNGEVVFTPPQHPDDITALMDNLLRYINDDAQCDADPLVKMALIHHQFESIHPFYDGNGRTGRIINLLYLVAKGLLDLPVLYLSRYIIQNKAAYYRELQQVREAGQWEPWLLYLLRGVAETARHTIALIHAIKELMAQQQDAIRTRLPKIYRKELLENLFKHPYTKIEFVMNDLDVTRLTATKYLDLLTEHGFVQKAKVGRNNFYVNSDLFDLLTNGPATNNPETPETP